MNESFEFALREVAVAIQYLIDVVANDPYAYETVPDSLHHALLALMREIEATNWEGIR